MSTVAAFAATFSGWAGFLTKRLSRPWASLRGVWYQLSIYLPVLLMTALAMGTYFLVRNSPSAIAPEAAQQLRHEPDYFMRKFTIKAFDESGQLKSDIYGVEAHHYPDTDTLEIDQPRMQSVGINGRRVTSTANRAMSNGDGSEVQLMGNAKVIREATKDANGKDQPQMVFEGEFLHAFVNDERVKSHKPVLLTRGADQFTGDTLAYDNITGVAELKGRVKGRLVPTKASGP